MQDPLDWSHRSPSEVAAPPLPPAVPGEPPPPPWERPRRGRRGARLGIMVPLLAASAVTGVLLGGRAATEGGRAAAEAALARGDAARAVTLYDAVAGRGGFLTLLDPGAAAAAERDAQLARIAWARRLAASGDVDSAVAALGLVREPAMAAQAHQAREQILLAAAAAAATDGHAELAMRRLDQAASGDPSPSLLARIASMRAVDEVSAATQLVAAGRAPDALALLDDASAHGAGAAAAAEYPAALLASAQADIVACDYGEARAALDRVFTDHPTSPQAASARALLEARQAVSGTLVDGAGRPVAGRVRLSTHFSQAPGGYVTTGPFYYGTADAGGDFSIPAVPVGGPYVLEYQRAGGWMTLIDPHTDQPADPVRVSPLQPDDLTFIVLPS